MSVSRQKRALLSANLPVMLTITIWTDRKLHSFLDKQKRTKPSKFTDVFIFCADLDIKVSTQQYLCQWCIRAQYHSCYCHVEMSLIVFLLRIKKLEKETALILRCKRNGWTDLSGQLEQYEKVLGNGKHEESKSFLMVTARVTCHL